MSAILKYDCYWSKSTTQKRPNFACGNYRFPKTSWKKEQRTSSGPIPPLKFISVTFTLRILILI